MKPKYIFGAVFAICVLMFLVLPQIVNTPRAANAAAEGVASNATINASAAAHPTAIPTMAPIAQNSPQAAPQQAAPQQAAPTQPAPTKAAKPAAQANNQTAPDGSSLPSPADPQAAPGQGIAAIPATSNLPDLAGFIASISNGQASQLVGVYVPGQFAMPVVQQLNGDINYVSTTDQTVTEYSRSSSFGVIGLLAHNTLSSGQDFFKLKPGQDVILIYGNGKQVPYRISRIENYQALSPNDPYSDFVDLNGPNGQLIHNEDLFQRIYEVTGQLVFQTCFAANGDPSWGRRFVIATPL
jgi:hypothetical protein